MFEKALGDYIVSGNFILPFVGLFLAAVFIAAAVAFAVPSVTRKLIPSPKATRLGDHLKFQKMAPDRRTIVGDDGLHTVVG